MYNHVYLHTRISASIMIPSIQKHLCMTDWAFSFHLAKLGLAPLPHVIQWRWLQPIILQTFAFCLFSALSAGLRDSPIDSSLTKAATGGGVPPFMDQPPCHLG